MTEHEWNTKLRWCNDDSLIPMPSPWLLREREKSIGWITLANKAQQRKWKNLISLREVQINHYYYYFKEKKEVEIHRKHVEKHAHRKC